MKLVAETTICNRQVRWLTSPEEILSEVKRILEENKCKTIVRGNKLEATCSGKCIIEVIVVERNPKEMIEALGTIALDAIRYGKTSIELEVRTTPTCTHYCREIDYRLMRGGG